MRNVGVGRTHTRTQQRTDNAQHPFTHEHAGLHARAPTQTVIVQLGSAWNRSDALPAHCTPRCRMFRASPNAPSSLHPGTPKCALHRPCRLWRVASQNVGGQKQHRSLAHDGRAEKHRNGKILCAQGGGCMNESARVMVVALLLLLHPLRTYHARHFNPFAGLWPCLCGPCSGFLVYPCTPIHGARGKKTPIHLKESNIHQIGNTAQHNRHENMRLTIVQPDLHTTGVLAAPF